MLKRNSTMGRFLSPDDGNDPDRRDPQSWNLYSYVRNSPLIHIDPSGQDCIYADGQGGGYLFRGDCASDTDNGIFVNSTVFCLSIVFRVSRGGPRNCRSLGFAPPDFLWNLVALKGLMRLSLIERRTRDLVQCSVAGIRVGMTKERATVP
jgi:hypothetical protein